MLTLKKVKELVEAPSHAKRTPSPKMLFEEGIVLLRREFDQGSHLTVYNSGYVLFSAGKRNTVFHIHDCCGDYAYDAAEGKGDVIEEEYFENCEWHIRALFEGERKMEDNQAKCEGAGRSNVCVSYHALSEDWSEIADRTINMVNAMYAKDISKKIWTSLQRKKEAGYAVGNDAPYGYIRNPVTKRNEIDPEAAFYVQLIFQWDLMGVPIFEIARRMTLLQVPTPREWHRKMVEGKEVLTCEKWGVTTIRHILENQTYVGDTINNKSTQ